MFLVLISINHVLTARFAKNKYVNCPSDAKTKENEIVYSDMLMFIQLCQYREML